MFPMLLDVFYDFILSFIGITAVIMVSKQVLSNRYINYVGQNTLIYFALHGKAQKSLSTDLKLG